MTRSEKRAEAALMRTDLKMKWLEMLRKSVSQGVPLSDAAAALDRAILRLRKEKPQMSATIDQAHREFAGTLANHIKESLDTND